MESTHVSLTVVLALFAGVAAQALARHAHLPAIVLLLATGAGLGPDGLGWVRPADLGDGLLLIVELAVAVVLFEGGLNLELAQLRRATVAIRRLLLAGALWTLLGGAWAAGAILGWGWERALLFGSLITVTGPTVIGPLVSELRLRSRVATVLEAEGVLIDPIGAFLATLALAVAIAPQAASMREAGLNLLAALCWGAFFGLLGGGLLAAALRLRRFVPEGLTNVFVLAWVLLVFQLSEQAARPSGLLAVVVTGMLVGNLRSRELRELREFKDQLSVMLIGLLFVLLAADVRIATVRDLGWGGFAVVAALVLLVRPLSVAYATWGSELSVRERLFVAWIAPRGIVAAAVASATAAELQLAQRPGATELRALVFLTIATTVLLAGVTGRPVANLLGVRSRARDRTAILGATGLGLLLGRELRSHGAADSVVFLDSNPDHAHRAEEAGFPVIFGNALEERTLLRARLGSVGTAIGVTSNEEVNGLFVMRAHDLFSVPRGYVALRRLRSAVVQEFVEMHDADGLFDDAHDVERWEQRIRQGAVTVQRFRFAEPPAEGAGGERSGHGERYLILAVQRGQRVMPMSVSLRLQPGDTASVALYEPELGEALESLVERGFAQRVDEVPASGSTSSTSASA